MADYTSWIFSTPPPDEGAPIFIDADCPDRHISWQQYTSSVKSVAVGLFRHGLKEQDCLAYLAPNDIYVSVLGDAVVAAGAIFAGLPGNARVEELASMCKAAQVSWLCTAPSLLGQALQAAEQSGISDDHIILFDPPGAQEHSQKSENARLSFSQLLHGYVGMPYCNPNIFKDPSIRIVSRLFTSGTIGAAKAANVSHKATLTRVKNGVIGKLSSSRRCLHFIGMHHVSGTFVRQEAIAGRYQMYITNAQEPLQIIDLIEKYEIESVILPPRTMIGIQAAIRDGVRCSAALKSLLAIVVGGSGVPNEAMDEFQTSLSPEANLCVGYGSTELGQVTCGTWGKEKDVPGGYVGRIYDSVKVKIVDPDTGKDIEAGSDGEICGHGEQTFSGYCGNEKATKASFLIDENGQSWFRTGDKGRVLGNGGLAITGRFKEIFKVDTEEVAPLEVEQALMKHDGVADVAVTSTEARDDPRYCEVKAYVVPAKDKKVAAQELVDFVATRLSAHKAPTGGVAMVDFIPRNAMNKVVTRELSHKQPLSGSEGYMNPVET